MSHDYKIFVYKDDFDFFDAPLPENNLLFAFGDQLNRARELLKTRSRAQINYIIESLDWMLKEGSKVLFDINMLQAENDEDAFSDRVKALKSYAEAFDISDQESLPNATWTDYFATLSLVTILEALHPDNFSEPFTDYAYPMEAMEAVCIAEFYKELSEYDKNQLRKRGQLGGKKRASKFDQLIYKLLSKYEATPRYQKQSNRQAARLLMQDFKEEIEKDLTSQEPRETIEKWIGKYKKGELKIPKT